MALWSKIGWFMNGIWLVSIEWNDPLNCNWNRSPKFGWNQTEFKRWLQIKWRSCDGTRSKIGWFMKGRWLVSIDWNDPLNWNRSNNKLQSWNMTKTRRNNGRLAHGNEHEIMFQYSDLETWTRIRRISRWKNLWVLNFQKKKKNSRH